MTFLDGSFYLFLAACVAAHAVLPRAWSSHALLACWVGWLAFTTPITLAVCGALAFFLCGAIHVLHRVPAHGRAIYAAANIGVVALVIGHRLDLRWVAAPLEAIRDFTFWGVPGTSDVMTVVGLSYAALKAHHLLFLARTDADFAPRPLRVLHFLVYLPTLPSGPILRWREFEQFGAHDPTLHDLDRGLRRIVLGLFKKVVLVSLLMTWMGTLREDPSWIVATPYLMLLILYLDFSGYSDVAIGIGRLFGHTVPENFKRPLSATSMSHFWRQWHASLTDWLREHVWIQLGGVRASKKKLLGITLVVMLFCGIWHELTWAFAAWGLYHGLLLAGEEALGIKPLSPRAPLRQRLVRQAMVLQLVALGVVVFL